VLLLFAVLALATAAIAYVSWPLVFALVVVGAGAWCRHLDRDADATVDTAPAPCKPEGWSPY
jgi:hypothetical protein